MLCIVFHKNMPPAKPAATSLSTLYCRARTRLTVTLLADCGDSSTNCGMATSAASSPAAATGQCVPDSSLYVWSPTHVASQVR